jgi:pimeloyl-ACP methyl ester carboxylesterase
VAAVVEAIGRAFVFGHSYGANCALEGALLTNDVEGLVLYEPGVEYSYPEGLIERLEELIEQGRNEECVVTAFEGFGLTADDIQL